MLQDMPVFTSELPHLSLLGRGKVRDLYAVDNDHILIVTTDRISAFDVVFSQPIPGKGVVLTQLSKFWFQRTRHIIDNHLTDIPIETVITDPEQCRLLQNRAVIVRRLRPLPIEAVVRGYLIGSGWKDYQQTGAICGIDLPVGLRMADRLPTVLFTPSTKAALGNHDENIDYSQVVALIGKDTAEQIRAISIQIYQECAAYAEQRGIIIADTKFEFGYDAAGKLVLIDEILTPDSSRFWSAAHYAPGQNPPSFDKQFVRDYVETLHWNKTPPAPLLPQEVITATADRYLEAQKRLANFCHKLK